MATHVRFPPGGLHCSTAQAISATGDSGSIAKTVDAVIELTGFVEAQQ